MVIYHIGIVIIMLMLIMMEIHMPLNHCIIIVMINKLIIIFVLIYCLNIIFIFLLIHQLFES